MCVEYLNYEYFKQAKRYMLHAPSIHSSPQFGMENGSNDEIEMPMVGDVNM
jgi:hypothetical protein